MAVTFALVAIVGQFALVGRAGAALATIACGQNVTTDVVLQADVGPCPGAGFTVFNAQNITIDLNGHRVVGPNDLTYVIGIRLFNANGVTVKGGTVTGFAWGVEVGASTGSTVTQMTIVDNAGGLVPGAGGFFDHGGGGISVSSFASHTVVRGNRVLRNGPRAGIHVLSANDTLVEGNLVQANSVRRLSATFLPNVVVQATIGIYVTADTARFGQGQRTVIRNNQVLDNGWHGIFLDGFSTGSIVAANQVHRNGLDQPVYYRIVPYGDGILVAAVSNTIEGNNVTGNGVNGIEIGLPGNVIRRNVALNNVQRPDTFPSFDLLDRITGCEGNTWSQNIYGTISQPCVGA